MHMLSRKEVNSAELDTVRASRNPTTVITANGEVQTNEGTTVYVYDFIFIFDKYRCSIDWKSLRRSRILQ